MTSRKSDRISFLRLTEIPVTDILDHMNDPRTARHLPLFDGPWGGDDAAAFVAAKEVTWHRDGLGHLAVLLDDAYAGWGGFEKVEGAPADTWDFGLVLHPDFFGRGARILHRFLAMARTDARIGAITFLLPVSRRNPATLTRLGAEYLGEAMSGDARFRKYRLVVRTDDRAAVDNDLDQQLSIARSGMEKYRNTLRDIS